MKAWYVGAVIYMFQVKFDNIGQDLLILINLAKTHEVDNKDKAMPIVEIDENAETYLVCSFENVICQVGLVRYNDNVKKFKVVTEDEVFCDSIQNLIPGKNSRAHYEKKISSFS